MKTAALASEGPAIWTFLGEAVSVGKCRSLARRLAADEDQAEAAALCVSELVTNALLHSRSGLPGGRVTVSMSLCRRQGGLRISVYDDGPRTVRPARSEPTTPGPAESGRGLAIVAAVAADWGISQPADDQGIAWCVIPAVGP
jgi:anti-sigma regulatory factor (Ser/Thr protein kinase)